MSRRIQLIFVAIAIAAWGALFLLFAIAAVVQLGVSGFVINPIVLVVAAPLLAPIIAIVVLASRRQK
jgi:hypothetical protein